MMTKTFATIALAFLIGFASPSASFAKGGNSSGGGHAAANGDLLDFFENEGTEPFNPLLVPGVKELLTELDTKLPAFSKSLKASLKKKWLLESKPLAECPGGTESLVALNGTVIACQNAIEVRISQSWFEQNGNDPVRAERNQLGVVVHEMSRSLNLRNQGTEEGLRALTRYLSTLEDPESTALQAEIARLGYGLHMSRPELDELTSFAKKADALVEQNKRLEENVRPFCERLIREHSQFIEELKTFNSDFRMKKAEVYRKVDEISARHRARMQVTENEIARFAPERQQIFSGLGAMRTVKVDTSMSRDYLQMRSRFLDIISYNLIGSDRLLKNMCETKSWTRSLQETFEKIYRPE